MSLRVSTSSPDSSACSGLMYSGVPTICAKPVKSVFSVSCPPVALATPKSMTLGTGDAVDERDQDVGGLEVPVDDPLLVRVLHRPADQDEQVEPSSGMERLAVAVVGDRDALDQLHDEVGAARVGGAGVEDLGDVGVVHQRQGLAFGLEAGDDLAGVHARLDDLQRHPAADRVRLLGHEDDAHAPLADRLQQLVGADDRAGALGRAGDSWTTVGPGMGCSRKLPRSHRASSSRSTRSRKSASVPQASSR